MEMSQLKEYLAIVLDMEQTLLYQKNAIAELEKELGKLENRCQPPLPPKRIAVGKGKPKKPGCMSIIFGGVTGFMVSIYGLAGLPQSNGGLYFTGVIGGTILGAFFAYRVAFWSASADAEAKYQMRVQKEEEKYQKKVAEYPNILEESKERIQKYNQVKAFIEWQLKEIENKYLSSRQTLYYIYATDVLYPKYRNLAMVSSLYEYVCAGRCASLGEAYNILELELLAGRIVTQLNIIISQLEKIQSNQYELYQVVQKSNWQTEELVSAVGRIVSNIESYQGDISELTNYVKELQKSSELVEQWTERTQKELSYLNRMNYLTGKNNGNFYNFPPSS